MKLNGYEIVSEFFGIPNPDRIQAGHSVPNKERFSMTGNQMVAARKKRLSDLLSIRKSGLKTPMIPDHLKRKLATMGKKVTR